MLLRGAGGHGVWRGGEAVREAGRRGVAIVDTELAGNVLGDMAVPGDPPAAFDRSLRAAVQWACRASGWRGQAGWGHRQSRTEGRAGRCSAAPGGGGGREWPCRELAALVEGLSRLEGLSREKAAGMWMWMWTLVLRSPGMR